MVLPALSIEWDKKDIKSPVTLNNSIFDKEKGLTVGYTGYVPKPIIEENDDFSVVVIGCPILDDQIDGEAVAKELLSLSNIKNFIAQLGGQFLCIRLDKKAKELTLVNDRFNGIPLYWACLDDSFIASFSYFDLFQRLSRKIKPELSGEAMLEFIWLQKLHYEKTYDTHSEFLLPATILTVSKGGSTKEFYWKQDFAKKNYTSEKEAGEEFVSLLQQSIRRLTSDKGNKRYGIFLSGGHDSRTLLAAFSHLHPQCFTLAFSDNYEVACARRAAEAVNSLHHFIGLPDDQFSRYQDEMAQLCGGLYATPNALFMGIEEQVQAHADVVFHGHGFDYLFQGMYLPTRTVTLFGRPTFFRKPIALPKDNLAWHYLNNISFRLANLNLFDYIQEDKHRHIKDYLISSTEEVMHSPRAECYNAEDRWEYMVTHALGRHYSYPNISSKMTCAYQRTVSFDNDLFNFYLSLPTDYRISAQVLRHTLNTLSPELGKIPTGNYGIAAGASPLYKTSWLIGRKLLRHLTGGKGLHTPHAEDRTWPDADTYLATHKAYQKLALEAAHSELLATHLPFFDWKKIQKDTELWISGEKSNGAKFISSLISLHRFLSLGS